MFQKIAIDCGHGCPPDTGASSIIKEDEAVEILGQALKAELINRGKQVVMCRPKTASSLQDSLSRRTRYSDETECDLYVSLHLNAYLPDGQTTNRPMGTEVFAISTVGKQVATRVEKNMVDLGWKSRGVKDGSHLFVLKYSEAPAILIEFCFLDSIPDVKLFKELGTTAIVTALASALLGNEPALNQPVAKTLGQLIEEGGCSTAELAGLNAGLIAMTNQVVAIPKDSPMIRVNDAAVNLVIAQGLEKSFWVVVNEFFARNGKPLTINSMYRTAAQQIALYEWFDRGMCGISACAKPGTSNHEAAQAIDTPDYDAAKSIFKANGWIWQMDKSGNDPVHFERDLGLGKFTVLALQKYWNKHNPGDQIAEDNQYGAITRSKALQLPINGY